MKITIDTKSDTREEIQKVVEMLSSFLGNSAPDGKEPPVPEKQEHSYGRIPGSDGIPASQENAVDVRDILIENKEEEIKMPEPEIVENVEKKKDDYKIMTY